MDKQIRYIPVVGKARKTRAMAYPAAGKGRRIKKLGRNSCKRHFYYLFVTRPVEGRGEGTGK